ncbi:hypothetical protein C8R44DRAFT_894879 [Mycena epipterygia]|nr:hypothetical protein C8R44DRAFT_894879 [Mycena epipterygia]
MALTQRAFQIREHVPDGVLSVVAESFRVKHATTPSIIDLCIAWLPFNASGIHSAFAATIWTRPFAARPNPQSSFPSSRAPTPNGSCSRGDEITHSAYGGRCALLHSGLKPPPTFDIASHKVMRVSPLKIDTLETHEPAMVYLFFPFIWLARTFLIIDTSRFLGELSILSPLP